MYRYFKTIFFLILLLYGSPLFGGWTTLGHPTTRVLYKLSFLDSLQGWVVGFKGTILKTTDGGLTWQAQDPGMTTDIHEVFALNSNRAWALSFDPFVDTNTWYGTKILSTTNGGVLWKHVEYPVSGEFFNAIDFKDSLNGWMAGEFGHMVRTTNGGTTWIPVLVDSSSFAQFRLLHINFMNDRYGYAMGGRLDIIGVVWRTTDGGQRWTPFGPSPEPVHDVHYIDSLNVLAVVGDADYGASIIRTTNGGDSWTYRYLQIFGEPLAVSFRTPSEGWSPLGFAGLLMSTLDTGATWTTWNTPNRRPIYDLVFTDSSTGYAVGDSGIVLKYSSLSTQAGENRQRIPQSFALHQNYPNPFNPATTIRFEIPPAGGSRNGQSVSLKVYDVLGREVVTLVNGIKQPGEYTVVWDASLAPGGVYFCRLTASSFVDVKKMLLIR